MNLKLTNRDLKIAIRSKYAWPGGYELFGITSDGAILCCECMRDNFESILYSRRHKLNDGWQVVGIQSASNLESAEYINENRDDYWGDYCAHCEKGLNP